MARVARRVGLVLSLALWLLVGCGRTTMVRVPVTFAARVPVRAFPSLWVSGAAFDEDQRLVHRLAVHLAQDKSIEVREVDLADLEPARLSGQIPATTAVVIIDLALREGQNQYWDSWPVQSCDYYGCDTQFQPFASASPDITAVATLSVHEGPTSRVLQLERVGRVLVGDDAESARLDVIELLAADVERLVDTVQLTERVTLYRVPYPEGEQALRRIRAGNWVEGRRLLEKLTAKLGGLKPRRQARIWFNLGQARRFAPGPAGLDLAAYQSAKRALEWAMRLDPRDQHQRALLKLERHYRNLLALAEEARARVHNRALLGSEAAVGATPAAAGPLTSEPTGGGATREAATPVGPTAR